MEHQTPQKVKLIRNYEPIPYIFDEGSFNKSLPVPLSIISNDKKKNHHHWSHGLSPHDRMFYHQTLTSARRSANFKSIMDIPKDSLDFILSGQYNHEQELFVNKSDVLLQLETLSISSHNQVDDTDRKTFRRLRNTRDVKIKRRNLLDHPLVIGKKKFFYLFILQIATEIHSNE